MRDIMDALSPAHPAQRVVFMKAAQVGATEAGNNWIGFAVHHSPGLMLVFQPAVELAKRYSRQRVDPLISESPALRERIGPSRSRDSGNTQQSKRQMVSGGLHLVPPPALSRFARPSPGRRASKQVEPEKNQHLARVGGPPGNRSEAASKE